MTHYKTLTNPNYIGSYSLMDDDEKSHDLPVTITGTSQEKVHNGTELDIVLTLHLKDQLPMILNATNQKTIVRAVGSVMVENWIGKTIILYVAKIKVGKDQVHALRIREELAKAKAKQFMDNAHPKWSEAVLAIGNGNATIEQLRKRYILTEESEAELFDHVTTNVLKS